MPSSGSLFLLICKRTTERFDRHNFFLNLSICLFYPTKIIRPSAAPLSFVCLDPAPNLRTCAPSAPVYTIFARRYRPQPPQATSNLLIKLQPTPVRVPLSPAGSTIFARLAARGMPHPLVLLSRPSLTHLFSLILASPPANKGKSFVPTCGGALADNGSSGDDPARSFEVATSP